MKMLHHSIRSMSVAVILVAWGCATMPAGPSVNVLPGPGKSYARFQREDTSCRQWAEREIGESPQQKANRNTATGAAAGTVLGAGAGALIGAASGNAGAGAAIGAGSGLLLGTAAGAGAGHMSAQEAQRRYDNVYVQCMYTKGNRVQSY